MGTVSDVLRIARGEIGYSRWDDPEEGTKYGRWYADLVGEPYYGASGVPYCAMFTSWVLDQAGVGCAGIPGAYCPWIVNAGRSEGRTVETYNAQPGDVVLFDWGNDGESDHVGIVEENGGWYLQCIEGNTNNGQVARRTREYGTICCVIRPYYDEVPYVAPDIPSEGGALDVDGWAGYCTISEWQTQLGTVVDGVVSGQVYVNRDYTWALSSVTWTGEGSRLVCEIQSRVGADVDGYWGADTSRHLQSYLIDNGYSCGDAGVDGFFGNDSARALQRSLNDGWLW